MNEESRSRTRCRNQWGCLGALAFAGAALGAGCESQADAGYRGEPLLSVTGHVEAALSAGPVDVGFLWLTMSGPFDLICTGEAETESGEPSACAAGCGEVTCDNLESWADCAESCSDVAAVHVDAVPPSDSFLTGGIGQTTPAVGEFPAQFSLDILEPPPPEALMRDASGQELGIGLVVALDPSGAPWRFELGQLEQPSWLLGGSMSHLVVFAPEAISEDSPWSRALGFTPGAGYQLVELSHGPCDDPEADCKDGEDRLGLPVPPGDASQVSLTLGPPGNVELPILNPSLEHLTDPMVASGD
jgi:hypothetical protein